MEILVFLGKALIILICFAVVILLIAMLVAKAQSATEMEVESLHEKYKDLKALLDDFTLDKKHRKALKKAEKKAKDPFLNQPRTFVLRFKGDVRAHQVEQLRQEVTAVLQVATPSDEVVVVVESPGGVVMGYGLAASQLSRIRDAGVPLTVCIDEVAASGGYLMAVVANKILAAPFAIVGSIGVVAQVPNLNKVLKKYDVDFKEYTAGEFKRTVTLFGEITPKGEQKFLEQLEATHQLFKSFVHKYRPQLDLAKVATGEYWYGQQAVELALIDGIQTSDDYLLRKFKDHSPLYQISFHKKPKLADKVSEFLSEVGRATVEKLAQRLQDAPRT